MPGASGAWGAAEASHVWGVPMVGVGREESSRPAIHRPLWKEWAAAVGIISVQHLITVPMNK